MQLLIDNARGEDMPEGWFKTTGLVVDADQHRRDHRPAEVARGGVRLLRADTIDELLGDVDANMNPLEDAR